MTEDNPWNDVPFFMTELPENLEDNAAMQAIQSLVYDGTPEEVAENFKKNGNDFFRSGKRDDLYHALVCYTRALEQKITDNKKNSVYLCNRAACNLKLGNYGRVIEDSKLALRFDKDNGKAYGRAAQALLNLKKYDEAINFCIDGLKIDEKMPLLKSINKKAQAGKEKLLSQQKQSTILKREKTEKGKFIQTMLATRGIKVRSGDYRMTGPNPEEKINLDADGKLHFPVLFLYPEYGQSDFITDFCEVDTFDQHFETMFPTTRTAYSEPQWDANAQYILGNLYLFFASADNKWLPIDTKTQLLAILSSRAYEMPGFPVFYIVSKNSPYLQTFLESDPKFL